MMPTLLSRSGTLVEQTTAPLDYTVSLLEFYAQALEDLQGDLPRVNTTPARKEKISFLY